MIFKSLTCFSPSVGRFLYNFLRRTGGTKVNNATDLAFTHDPVLGDLLRGLMTPTVNEFARNVYLEYGQVHQLRLR